MVQISGSGVCGQGKEWEGGENPDPSNLIIKHNLMFRGFFSIIACRFVVLMSLAIHDASVTRYA
jgi:hypothetical protein